MNPKPLTANDLMSLVLAGEPIPLDRALATYADPNNWVQLYHSESLSPGYEAKPCEWAFIGPVRPPYELAQNALADARKTP